MCSEQTDRRFHLHATTEELQGFNSIALPSSTVITGATDGIGREYARGLAKRRINVILISRTESKLLDVCSEIKMKYGVKAKYIVADFTRGAPIYANIEQTLKDVPVGILGKEGGGTAPQ